MKRLQQLVKPGTEPLDMSGYWREVLACDRLSHAKQKEIMELVQDGNDEPASSVAKTVKIRSPTIHKKLVVVFLFACNLSQEVPALLMGVSKSSIHYWIAGVCTAEVEWQMLREIPCWSGKVCVDSLASFDAFIDQ